MIWSAGKSLKNGHYKIDRELGRGRFAITYLAKHPNGERWVIKILNPDVLQTLNDEDRQRLETLFWQEAVKLAKCSGTPHIVKMATPFEEGMVACLPMEYIDGNSLRDRSESILSEAIALEYIQQIGEALTVVHGQQLVHGDVRPANIFLRIRDGKAEAVLTDFGLALDCDAVLTRTRDKERADGFSPIELYARGQAVGAYTDVYSLAATLYELLTGEVPVSAYDRKVNGCELVSPQVKHPEISARTTKAILAGMELEEAKRPQSVQAWLEKLGVGNQVQVTPKNEVNWTKWQTIWAAVAVVVSLLVGIPAWLALKPDSPPTPPASSTLPNTSK